MGAEIGFELLHGLHAAEVRREGIERGARFAKGGGGFGRAGGEEEDLATAGEPSLLPLRVGAEAVEHGERGVEMRELHLDVAECERERDDVAELRKPSAEASGGGGELGRFGSGESLCAGEEKIRLWRECDGFIEIGDGSHSLSTRRIDAGAGDERGGVLRRRGKCAGEGCERLVVFMHSGESEAAPVLHGAESGVGFLVVCERGAVVLVRALEFRALVIEFAIFRLLHEGGGDGGDLIVEVAVGEAVSGEGEN